MNLVTFTADRLVRKAVTKCLEFIADASKNLSPASKVWPRDRMGANPGAPAVTRRK
jgi:hypothetical protein